MPHHLILSHRVGALTRVLTLEQQALDPLCHPAPLRAKSMILIEIIIQHMHKRVALKLRNKNSHDEFISSCGRHYSIGFQSKLSILRFIDENFFFVS